MPLFSEKDRGDLKFSDSVYYNCSQNIIFEILALIV